ncbi:DNA repair protein RAD5 [Geosmithia morbida]|uniref:DNA repair protein RAD5 n=1 Tax=Geosmithia morbida TaxID=1094350 RepID=A0A9P4YMQ0_9HYPO|nr:DNA repair protein RAD5 [Geosmithia morbida]KAF4119798.1 DNA repair protein RAD5 [Geosmithia morbida]
MYAEHSQGPPVKRRRFFHDQDEAPTASTTQEDHSAEHEEIVKLEDDIKTESESKNGLFERSHNETAERSVGTEQSPTAQESSLGAFDQGTFESFVGAKVGADVMAILRDKCGSNLECAVNMYFDRTYQKLSKKAPRSFAHSYATTKSTPTPPTPPSRSTTSLRYIGAFGAEGWATRSGANFLKHGDIVRIERQKVQPPQNSRGKGGKLGGAPAPNSAAARRVDVLVRFTTQSGVEIGRLAKDTANWVSTLMDQKICKFEGTCVYAPDRLRTNDTVFLQLRCFLLGSAFLHRRFQLADNRSTNPFEQNETADEKELRLRQTAIVRLLQEINLQPTAINSMAKDGKEGLLKVAEMDEQKQRGPKRQDNMGKDAGSGQASDEAEEGKELEQDQLDSLYRKAQSFDFNTPEAEPTDTFAMQLRPYQKQSLYWMIAKEKDQRGSREPSMHPLWEEYAFPTKDVDDKDLPLVESQAKFYVNPYSGDLSLDFPEQEQHCLGGILADEMGLGKTIQILSLIHSHRTDLARQSRQPAGDLSGGINGLQRLGSGSPPIQDAPFTTLVIAPMSLLSQWRSEAEKASQKGTLKVELYYGNEKSSNLQALCSSSNAASAPDIVITSYGIVLSEFSTLAARNGDKSLHNGIFSLKFFRVVLDEAHNIKNRSSKTARACYEISAEHRWALTGTPIVNRLEDLFSLVRFLGVEPWNNFSFWRTFITVPFESGDFVRALDVVQTVLEPLVMRRTKDMRTPDGEPLVPLPPKKVEIVEVELSQTERDVYDYIYTKAKNTFSKNMETGTVMKAFTTIFAQILRLRQSCCHPLLVRNREVVADEEEAAAAADASTGFSDDMDLDVLLSRFSSAVDEASKDNQTFGAQVLGEIRNESDKECPLCFEEPMNDQTVTGCWHSACKTCLQSFMKHESDRGVVPKCFNCRAPLNRRDLFKVVRHDEEVDAVTKKPRISLQRLGASTSSAKVEALIGHLRALRKEHPLIKSVVFSQFTSFLNLIEPVLTRANIRFLRLDGTMAQKARAAVLQEFADSPVFTVLLISLRAGGVGLNLTSAGRVFMMDPWWSFAVEAQAIDRVHRMGQQHEVQVKRFVVKESVEERMLRIQDRKKFM